MMTSMELSLYPLGTENIGRAVNRFIESLQAGGCEVTRGPMSSLVTGESELLFRTVNTAYEAACAESGIVLVIKASNVCAL